MLSCDARTNVARSGGCPSSAFFDDVARYLRRDDTMSFVVVGANKVRMVALQNHDAMLMLCQPCMHVPLVHDLVHRAMASLICLCAIVLNASAMSQHQRHGMRTLCDTTSHNISQSTLEWART